MPPTPQDQQLPSPQDLPILKDPIDPTTIVPAEAVEANQSENHPDALSAYEASRLEAPVAPNLDSDEYKVTRSHISETSESQGVSRGKKIAVALTGAAVLAGGAAATNMLPSDSDSVTTSGSNTEQLQDESDTVDSATTTTTAEVVSDSAVSDLGEPVAVDTANPTDGLVAEETNESSNDTPTETATVIEDSITPEAENNASDTPEFIQDVVGAEDYPGEVSVIRAVDFAQYLMNNQQKTGIDPAIELSDSESGTLTFSDPNGYVFTVTGRMADGNIILDDSMPMSGIGAITIIDAKGNHLTVKNSKDANVKPGLSVAVNGQNPITTNQELFPGALLDVESAKHQGAMISADIEGYFNRTHKQQ